MIQRILPLIITFFCCYTSLFAQPNGCLTADITVTDPTCEGDQNGTATLIPTNGVPPYTHSGIVGNPPGQFTDAITFTNLSFGSYAVDVYDADSTCSSTLFFALNGPPGLGAFLTVTDVTCGGDNGIIEITAFGGFPPYTYNWNPSVTTANTATGLAVGLYEMTVTDSNGCIWISEAEVNENTDPIVLDGSFQDIGCNGESSGGIELIVNGNNGNYSFLWSNNETAQSIFNLAAGTYCVTVQDLTFGCFAVECYDLVEPEPITLEVETITPSSGNDGMITVLLFGGIPPYAHQWSNGSGGGVATGLAPGTYSLTVTDANNCSAILSGMVVNSSDIIASINNVDCHNEATGSIDLAVNFGTAPHSFLWSGPGSFTSTTQNITNITAGTYSVVVTDDIGITASGSYNVTQNDSIVVNMSFPWVCAGDPIMATISAFGGVSPYTYNWGGLDPNNLPEGSFTVTVTDALGCTLVHNDMAISADPITISITPTNPTCQSNNGCLETNVTGGSGNYSFIWSPGQTTQTICQLPEGTYSVTVTDGAGCTATATEVLVNIAGPEVTMTGSPTVCDDEGFIDVQVTGSGPFTFDWFDDPNENSPNRTDLGPGNYIVLVLDNNGCADTASFEIETSIMLEVSSTTADCDSTGGTATVTVTGGAVSPTYLWSNNETTPTISNLSPGGYSVTVTDPGPGCRSHKNVIVELDPSCFVTIGGTVYIDDLNQDCLPDVGADGASGILITLDSGESTFTNSNGEYAFNVLPGIYDVSMTVNNPQYEAICLGTITADVSISDATDVDFFVIYSVDKDLKIYVNKGNARPGFTQSIQICVWNFGSEPANGTLTFVHDPIQIFLSANPTEDTYDLATQTVTWNFTNLVPGGVAIFRPKVKLDPSVPLGTPLNLNFEVTPITGDLTPWNNTIHCPMITTGSYDPNDKAVSPGIGEEGIIYATDTLLTYRVRFQNTGTDTAFTVVIRDELMPELDIETVIPGPSSHDYNLTVEGERTLVFTFDNIMLPDSFVNEPASNGFVFFDVRPVDGTGYGTVIENTAGIYFDFNPPVITNTIVTTFTEYGVGTKDLEDFKVPLLVQPNPTSGDAILTYSIDEPQEVWIKVFDLQGRQVATLQTPQRKDAGTHQKVVRESLLPGGVYWIQVETSTNLRGISKMIKID